eukprot:TRINITY_DN11793_c0_g1_i1.p1 TRINITY_DN11793_c0_g1~~TRINITY_DN11793_c0_g1_i1.p1  ORF type:complete len:670 (+),score=133.54 TRINITY_DN11793_c0_g1_i1:87-2096(+)
MSMRDLVETCGDDSESRRSNPLLNMVDMFTSEKQDSFQDQWEYQFQAQFRGIPQNQDLSRHFDHNVYADPRTFKQVGSFLNPREGPLEDFSDFSHALESTYSGIPSPKLSQFSRPPPVSPSVAHLNDRFLAFIRSFQTNNPTLSVRQSIGAPPSLTPIEKEKIRSRVSVLSRHLNLNEDLAHVHVSHLLTSLNIPVIDPVAQQVVPVRSDWVTEFNKSRNFGSHNVEDWTSEYEKTEWHDAYLEREFQEAFNDAGNVNEWVHSFNNSSQTEEFDRRAFDLATRAVNQINDPKLQNSSFLKLANKLNDGRAKIVGKSIVESDDVQNDWAERFSKEMFTGKSDWVSDYETWENNYGEGIDSDDSWLQQYQMFQMPNSKPATEYTFQENNIYLQQENPYETGIELFEVGNIPQAILAFEAAVQKSPTFSQAWQYLGRSQAENDKDDLAILALSKAVETDPQNLDALLNLGVSYTNDFHKDKALECLIRWLAAHPEYSSLAEQAKLPDGDYDIRHETVAELFLEAARSKASDPDPEVQGVLGVLYNLSFEYALAIDCFKTALYKRPNDYLLWNRLGATQANGSRSEEAIQAYYRALKIKPTYTRARSNLGISFLSLKDYVESAKSFLGALSINPNAEHIWDHLRTVFGLMSREDLVSKLSRKDVELFRGEFAF